MKNADERHIKPIKNKKHKNFKKTKAKKSPGNSLMQTFLKRRKYVDVDRTNTNIRINNFGIAQDSNLCLFFILTT